MKKNGGDDVLSEQELRTLAHKGAELELERIFAVFPDLRPTTTRDVPAPAKKKHWTQTAAGRRKMSVLSKRAWKKAKSKTSGDL